MYPYYSYSNLPKLDRHKVWAELDVNALCENFSVLRKAIPSTRHICVVKADAYGHISDVCVKALAEAGCDFFAVSCIEEALAVRKICRDADVLILGFTDPSQADSLAKHNIIQAVISYDHAASLASFAEKSGCSVRVHVALDTGMNRVGLCARTDAECHEAADMIKQLSQSSSLRLEGIFTHFAQADEPYEGVIAPYSRTRIQYSRFESVKKRVEDSGIKLFCHVCNSAAALRFPEYALDGVRIGISLYGVRPSEHFDNVTRPVMSLHTVISHVHPVPAGEKVSYGGRFAPDTPRTVATLPIGYADGFIRAFKGYQVTVKTAQGSYKAPVVGSICMDQCMIDVTDLPVAVGDQVTVFGEDPRDLATLARLAGTIEYEVLCLVSARVPRVVKKS